MSHPSTDASEGTPAAPTAPRRATFAFMVRHPARWLALGFGSGLAPKAPGTVGSLWGWAGFLLINPWVTPLQWAGVLVVGLLVGWWACTVTARHLGVCDPGSVVWDEILAMWIILWLLMPASLWWQAAAFGVFRYFDAVKPGPVRWADSLFKSPPGAPVGARQGFGILFDDLVAAGCTLLVLAVARHLLH
jgi:phosphatidylglycerophosphatase A